jgi:Flp pilus assembly protein TadD
LTLSPSWPGTQHGNLASALAARGRIDEAVSHYRRALQLDPNNRETRAELDKLLGLDPSGLDPNRPDPPSR